MKLETKLLKKQIRTYLFNPKLSKNTQMLAEKKIGANNDDAFQRLHKDKIKKHKKTPY